MKKVVLILLLILTVLLSSCNPIADVKETTNRLETLATTSNENHSQYSVTSSHNEAEKDKTDVIITSKDNETDERTTFANGLWRQPNEISAKLAELINEDGTGKIYLGMKREDAIKVLEKENIPYEIQEEGRYFYIFNFSDGSSISSHETLEQFYLAQTNKGLKIGDPASKIEEVYGKAKVDEGTGIICYTYYYENDIIFTVYTDDKSGSRRITYFDISEVPSWAYESGANA